MNTKKLIFFIVMGAILALIIGYFLKKKKEQPTKEFKISRELNTSTALDLENTTVNETPKDKKKEVEPVNVLVSNNSDEPENVLISKEISRITKMPGMIAVSPFM